MVASLAKFARCRLAVFAGIDLRLLLVELCNLSRNSLAAIDFHCREALGSA